MFYLKKVFKAKIHCSETEYFPSHWNPLPSLRQPLFPNEWMNNSQNGREFQNIKRFTNDEW